MPTSNILHATTDPDLLTRLREMLDSSARADIAVGYFFISGFEAVADILSRLDKGRILAETGSLPRLHQEHRSAASGSIDGSAVIDQKAQSADLYLQV